MNSIIAIKSINIFLHYPLHNVLKHLTLMVDYEAVGDKQLKFNILQYHYMKRKNLNLTKHPKVFLDVWPICIFSMKKYR